MNNLHSIQKPDEYFRNPPSKNISNVRRKIPSIALFGTTEEELDKYFIFGYLNGDKIDREKSLTIDHFDTIQKIKNSTNPKVGGDFIHVIGHRLKEKEDFVLVLKLKKKKPDPVVPYRPNSILNKPSKRKN